MVQMVLLFLGCSVAYSTICFVVVRQHTEAVAFHVALCSNLTYEAWRNILEEMTFCRAIRVILGSSHESKPLCIPSMYGKCIPSRGRFDGA